MSGIPTVVKWGKETIELNLVPADGVMGLKSILEDKTGVPKDRMKLMPKSKGLWKGVLKDDFDLKSIDFGTISQRPISLLLMGSAAKVTGPKEKTLFVEDMSETEVAQVTPEPSGLVNLGNTCYLNSVMQCLRAVPTLRHALSAYTPSSSSSSSLSLSADNRTAAGRMVVSTMREMYTQLDSTTKAIQPGSFVMAVKLAFPQFAQLGPRGQPMQQDAEEFFSAVMANLAEETKGFDLIRSSFQNGPTKPITNSQSTPASNSSTSTEYHPQVTEEQLQGADNLIDAVFGLKMEETLTCDEVAATTHSAMQLDSKHAESTPTTEPVVKSYDLLRKLVCNIQGGSDASSQVNVTHIAEGIHLSLNGSITKHSEVLGRDATWSRKQRIARLPPVIVVQFGRFYWKATPESQDHAGVKCKVMKPVAFTDTLDVYDFCTPKVQAVLKVSRDKARSQEEDVIAKKLKGEREEKERKEEAEAKETQQHEKESAATTTPEPMATDDAEDDEKAALEAALAMSLEKEQSAQPPALDPIGPGLPPDFQGKYELFAVVTHKGRDADGGHYMGWVKSDVQQSKEQQEEEMRQLKKKKPSSSSSGDAAPNEDWYVFDDDQVSPCKTENVLQLKGGGDWHMSYLNFYRAKQ